MAGYIESVLAYQWANPAGAGAHARLLDTAFGGSLYCGRYQCAILVDRDYEAVDPPPSAPQPVKTRVFLYSAPNKLCIADGWSNASGWVTFKYLASPNPNPNGSYYAMAFGFNKQMGGRWNAEIQDDLTLEPMP